MKMNLPNYEKAYVPKQKLSNYLLSETHAVGKAKARYFRPLGYTEENADQLADALLMIAKPEGVSQELTSRYGTKYIIDGELVTPIGTRGTTTYRLGGRVTRGATAICDGISSLKS